MALAGLKGNYQANVWVLEHLDSVNWKWRKTKQKQQRYSYCIKNYVKSKQHLFNLMSNQYDFTEKFCQITLFSVLEHSISQIFCETELIHKNL